MRVIGLPGDRIKIKNKQVIRNGKFLEEPYVTYSDNQNIGFPRRVVKNPEFNFLSKNFPHFRLILRSF